MEIFIMRLNEIDSINFIRKDSEVFITLYNQWKEKMRSGCEVDSVGKIGPYRILTLNYKVWSNDDCKMYCIYDIKKEEEPAGFVELYSFGNSNRVFEVNYVGISKKYQGQGLSVALYTFLIQKLNLILMSGSCQSMGGRDIWTKLGKVNGIFMFAYDKAHKKSYQIEQDDLFNTDVYTADILDEIDELEQERDEIIANSDLNINQALQNKKVMEINQKISDYREEVRSLEKVYLVAIKGRKK